MEETPDQRESFVQLVLPFVTVPFRPLVIINTLQYPRHLMDRIPYIFIRTIIRGSFLISIAGPLYPRHSQAMPPNWHFSRRELRLFNVPPFLPPNREDHRARVRARLGTNTNTNTSAFPSSSSAPSVFGGGSGGTTLGSSSSSNGAFSSLTNTNKNPATSAFGQPSLLSVNIMLSTRRSLFQEKEYQRRVPIDIPVLIGAQLRSHRYIELSITQSLCSNLQPDFGTAERRQLAWTRCILM
ncbi:hypothetical protein F5878DRAFT_674826 [Lentinula raphanica]|uniref:Uncharacterized protein n=1 Tax=Lentinula raphanica TaxID=153919 RepID=A0AA38NVU2_9AGAR|nr:hypothetical protein F5878DRAFT_674826 [Lentinula raphanica]